MKWNPRYLDLGELQALQLGSGETGYGSGERHGGIHLA